MSALNWVRLQWQMFRACRCGQHDGGPYGYREHWCTTGCPLHGPDCEGC